MQNRVLLVEDDDELRELLSRYLSNQGLTVRETVRGPGYSYRVPA